MHQNEISATTLDEQDKIASETWGKLVSSKVARTPNHGCSFSGGVQNASSSQKITRKISTYSSL